MAVAANADDYTNGRINIFFPGVIPSLDGQCVSLVKGFMQDMSGVPDPQAARGDARYVGKTLEAQGHAVEVAWADRKRGDIVCYEYGTYGHIGVLLSGNRTFEENVNWPGVDSKIVDGSRVYASRIGDMAEGWRHDMHIYRLNTYNEGDDMIQDSDNEYGRWEKAARQIRGRRQGFTRDEFRQAAVGRTWLQALEILSDDPESDANYQYGRMVDDDMTNLIYEVVLHRAPEGPDAYNAWRGRPIVQVIQEIKNSDEGKALADAQRVNEGDAKNILGLLLDTVNANDIAASLNKLWKSWMYDDVTKHPRFIPVPTLLKIIDDLKKQVVAGGNNIDPKTQAQLDRIDQNTTATRGLVQTIFDYFAGQYATFKKYIKK